MRACARCQLLPRTFKYSPMLSHWYIYLSWQLDMKFVLVNDITMYGIGTEIFCLFKLLKQSRYKKLFRSNKTLIFWRPFWNEFFGFFDQNFSRSSISQSWRRYDSPILPNIASKFDYFAQNIALNFDFCHHIALILSFLQSNFFNKTFARNIDLFNR